MKLNILQKQAIDQLEEYSIDSSHIDSRVLLQHVTNLPTETIYLSPEHEISNDNCITYMKLITRRCNHEPVAKIIGKKDFWKSSFIVNNNTLDPRPDSEVIIESALDLLKDKAVNYSFLDLGTGSGCLILSLLKEFSSAKGIAIDVSAETLKVTKANAINLELTDRVTLLQQNWADNLTDKFDLIVSNPPYIPNKDICELAPEVKIHDPLLALDGGIDGLTPYKYLAPQILKLLKPEAYAILEFGYNQSNSVKEIFMQHGYKIHKILKDLSGLERAIIVSL